MMRFVPKLLLAAGLGFIGIVIPESIAADPPKETPAASDKPADWSKFATVTDISGEITKSDSNGFTLRVTFYGPKGGTNTRPQLSGGGQSRMRQPQMVAQHHDYDLKYADGGVVRQMKLPPKAPDEKGRKVEYTVKELENIKKPVGMPYYAADRSELQAGSIVEVRLVRPLSIPSAKVTEADLQVKYVVIHSVSKPTTDPAKKN
jgi:hypothetical protein